MSLNADQTHDVLDQVAQIDAGDVKFEFTRLNLREIQNVVQDRQQRLGAVADGFRIVALLIIQASVQHEVSHADNPVHGGAYLMAHVGEKLTFSLIGDLRGSGHGFGLPRGGQELLIGRGEARIAALQLARALAQMLFRRDQAIIFLQ